MTLDDKLLVELARQGSSDAIGELYERYWPVVWTAAFAITGRRALADDAASEAMHRAFRALGGFDTSRPLGPWLKRIGTTRLLRTRAVIRPNIFFRRSFKCVPPQGRIILRIRRTPTTTYATGRVENRSALFFSATLTKERGTLRVAQSCRED